MHTHLDIATPKGSQTFQLRLIREEGIGLLTAPDDTNYLILDSLDYWYDLIQNEYPKKKKCSCKNEWFTVKFDYIQREDTLDLKNIDVITTCTQCNKVSKAMTVDIDYSPTQDLLIHPITFCDKPRIKYKFKDLSAYWQHQDLKDFLSYMFNDLDLYVYCWYWHDGRRHFQQVNYEKAITIITVNHRYLNFFFSVRPIEEADMDIQNHENGVYIKGDPWRKLELIDLATPTHMVGYGLIYYIRYCIQYLDKGIPVDKSSLFREKVTSLENWLKTHFVTKRGRNCYDGQAAYEVYKNKSYKSF